MDRELIVKALKSVCGNKNLRFQVIVQEDRLHIYVNRKEDYQPDYIMLESKVADAIASLKLDSLDAVWLYCRQLGKLEPDWQTFVELPTQINSANEATLGSTENLDTEIDVPKLSIENLSVEDSTGDTGLLQNQGMVHGTPLKEETINIFADNITNLEFAAELPNSGDYPLGTLRNRNLAQYCWITNKKLLTSEIIPPEKEIMRLVKFFHNLSEKNQDRLLPILDSYFQHTTIADLQKLSVAVQKWFRQITELNDDQRRMMAIWLSRYCFDSSATLAEFNAVAVKNTTNATHKKAKSYSTEYSFKPAKVNLAKNKQPDELAETKFSLFSLPQVVKKFVLPVMWTIATVILLVLGIVSNNSNTVASEQNPALCNNTIGSVDYCRLAVNLAGEKKIARSPRSIFPLTEATETVATYGCERYANFKAGVSTNLVAPEQTPVIFSYGEKVLPHIYVVEAQQKNAQQPGNIKVGCVYTTGQGQRSPELLAADLIPFNWPAQSYQQQAGLNANLDWGIYTNPINLGLNTLFAALGIAIASWLNLGLKINHADTIYLAALILGIVQLITASLPAFGLIGAIALPILTILVMSLLIKDFKINWNHSYPLIAASIFTIIAVQFLLYGLCLGLLNSLV